MVTKQSINVVSFKRKHDEYVIKLSEDDVVIEVLWNGRVVPVHYVHSHGPAIMWARDEVRNEHS